MSREFGSYNGGYFHQQIDNCANDALAGRDELTRLWGQFLAEFSPIAYSIASSEACDSGEDDTIIETIARLSALQKRLYDVEKYVESYKRVAEEAVRKALRRQNDK